MHQFEELQPNEWIHSPFQVIGKDWMLITTAKEDGGANPMTASWGGLGILWHRPVAYCFIRPARYTRELIDAGQPFSLDFLDESYRRQLEFCGQNSGRDVDKMAACQFTTAHAGDTPYIGEAHTVMLCRALYRQPLGTDFFLDNAREIEKEMYSKDDYSILYVAEITSILTRC